MTDPLWDALQALPPAEQSKPVEPAKVVQLLRAEGKEVTLTTSGQIITDSDGVPAWIEPPTTTVATLSAPFLTASEWESVARYLLGELDKKEAQNE